MGRDMRVPLPVELLARVRRWCAAQQLDRDRTLDALASEPGDFVENVERLLLTGAWVPPRSCDLDERD